MKKSYHAFSWLVSKFADKNRCQFVGGMLVAIFALSSCAYRMTSQGRSLPQGYRQMTVPIFKNFSQDVGAEVAFTNSFIQEFQRSKVATVVDPAQAEVMIQGEIRSVSLGSSVPVIKPNGTSVAGDYTMTVIVGITVLRLSDKSILWAGEFKRADGYSAAKVSLAGINTVNPLYNLSARRQKLDLLARDMMAEAHDRLTENF